MASRTPLRSAGIGRCLPVAGVLLSLVVARAAAQEVNPQNFESAPVHPVELSADRTRLFVAHTADHRLVVFDLTGDAAPIRVAEVQVGLEPVTVRALSGEQVWVVNHVSDSISLVDLHRGTVTRTLRTGDGPNDVVFAHGKAFVSIEGEDCLEVFDLADLDASPVRVMLNHSRPRSLALAPDQQSLYVAGLDSQNRTTIVPDLVVQDNGGLPPADPPMLPDLPSPPAVGLIVRHDGEHWRDEIARVWDDFLPYQLYDQDVIEVSTTGLAVLGAYSDVGTNLFNLAVAPSGRIYCTNFEAQNHRRFEPNLSGSFSRNNLTIIDPALDPASVRPVQRHLNEHIDYGRPTGSPGERAMSLAQPLDIVVSADGSRLYVAAFGSRKVAELDPTGTVLRRFQVGDGPAGLALDSARNRLYVMNRFSSSLSVVALDPGTVVDLSLGYDPTPETIREGRRFLYDGEVSSAHGDLSCGTCHLFGDVDGLSWDLGNPQGKMAPPPNFFGLHPAHPMKGPMVTQSLRALPGTGRLHWRGDRVDFLAFNAAFVGLMGRETQLDPFEMELFQEFIFDTRYPPSPNRELDGSLPLHPVAGGDPRNGYTVFLRPLVDDFAACGDCHTEPTGTLTLVFGAREIREEQDFKVPHLRNQYTKVGFTRDEPRRKRGFGYQHDGSLEDVVRFLESPRFVFQKDQERYDLQAFLFCFDTGTPAAVGHQITFGGTAPLDADARLSVLLDLASGDQIGLVAKGIDTSGDLRGWSYDGIAFLPDRAGDPPLSPAELRAIAAPLRELTFTGVLEGTERRLGIDRDLDGTLDRDEIDAGSDPGDPRSTPIAADVTTPLLQVVFDAVSPNPVVGSEARLRFVLSEIGPARLVVFDAQGRRVRTLFDRAHQSSGAEVAVWDVSNDAGRRVSDGVYFVRLETPSGSASRRVVVR
ncbi:MAG: T9SS type A sorting domain-containing protein [Candidatus Eisenbacteria bacterium]|nr:T9SS type A sorting domain-containing protein [Candidatus Eisenbacteria bacterium]